MKTITIIGGGPAGALAAELLARGGCEVTLLDEKLAWEKPCGGGVTPRALRQYPFLRDGDSHWVRGCEVVSPAGRRVYVPFPEPVAIFSRQVLNGLLLERARSAGAEVVRERVTAIAGPDGCWELRTSTRRLTAAYIVLAAGARNPFRAQFSIPFAPQDLMATTGYFLHGSSPDMLVRFLEGLHGYFWMFPRCDHYSAGICGRLAEQSTSSLRQRLEDCLQQEGISWQGADFYSHLLPAPTAAFLRRAPYSGRGWAMVGDAAGFVDPITGEGLYYALRSAGLLAQALLAGDPELYPKSVARDFLPELLIAAHWADRFFTGSFFGLPVLERMVQFGSFSSRFRGLLSEIFAGSQGYCGLRRRAWNMLPLVLLEGLLGGRRSGRPERRVPSYHEAADHQQQHRAREEQPVPRPDVEEMDYTRDPRDQQHVDERQQHREPLAQ